MSFYFESGYKINSHDCDINNVLRPSGVLRYLQETANIHVESIGFGYDRMAAEKQAFVLSRLSLVVHRPIHAYEEVLGRTWACQSQGASFNRCSQLIMDGKPAAELSAIWALLNFEDKTLVKVSDSGWNAPSGPLLELSAPLKFRIPKTLTLQEVGNFKVGYSVCDRNMHMNNTRYPDMLFDFLPIPQGKRLHELSIYYKAEAHIGEELRVFMAQDPEDGAWYFRTIRLSDEAVGIEARVVLDAADA